MKAKMEKSNKLRFVAVGAVNTALDFSIFLTLTELGINKYFANTLSTSSALVFSFFANRSYTFSSKSDYKTQIAPFLVVTLTGLWIIQPVVIYIATYITEPTHNTTSLVVAKLSATIASTAWNYILYSKFVFKAEK